MSEIGMLIMEATFAAPMTLLGLLPLLNQESTAVAANSAGDRQIKIVSKFSGMSFSV
ncbi:MAG: hypothetical protein LC664_03970 [Flavobacteriales bacterium]|nr:hypothetical protein [Flavobacteriales bacterium]